MIITHAENHLKIETVENQIPVLVLEHPHIFAEFVESLYLQCAGNDGKVVISENGKTLSLSKESILVFDYFALDFNNRKIQTRLFQQLQDIGSEFFESKEEFTRQGVEMMETILSASNFDHVEYDLDLDWKEIFKLFHVSVEEDYVSLPEKLISFLRICAELLNLRMVVFVNLKAYLTEEELGEFYQMAGYFKLQLLLIEAHESPALPQEKYYIIDKDRCLIIK